MHKLSDNNISNSCKGNDIYNYTIRFVSAFIRTFTTNEVGVGTGLGFRKFFIKKAYYLIRNSNDSSMRILL